jgi:hypothetical protein
LGGPSPDAALAGGPFATTKTGPNETGGSGTLASGDPLGKMGGPDPRTDGSNHGTVMGLAPDGTERGVGSLAGGRPATTPSSRRGSPLPKVRSEPEIERHNVSKAPNPRKVGVWLIGARGSISTCLVYGLAGIREGMLEPTGVITQKDPFTRLRLVDLDALVLGGTTSAGVISRTPPANWSRAAS